MNWKKCLLISLALIASRLCLATEKDLYQFMWLDPDKKVFVLQNKIHTKKNTFYMNIGGGFGPSSAFTDTTLSMGNAGYYLTEELAIEGNYLIYHNSDNESLVNLQRLNNSVPFIRRPISSANALLKWSPFYGKINTFNKIFYFDWSFGVGGGILKCESNKDTVSNPSAANNYSQENFLALTTKTELTLHMSKHWHLSLGLLMNNFRAPGPTLNNEAPPPKLRTSTDSFLQIGFSF